MRPITNELRALFLNENNPVDYDDMIALFHKHDICDEPPMSMICFFLTVQCTYTPEEAELVKKRFAELATNVLDFNLFEANATPIVMSSHSVVTEEEFFNLPS